MASRDRDEREQQACVRLAQRFDTDPWEGSERPGWQHAMQLAQALDRYGWVDSGDWSFWVNVAWLHELLENRPTMTQQRLGESLVAEGVQSIRAHAMARMVAVLTRSRGEGIEVFRRVRKAHDWQLSLIKVLDRILHLEQGRKTMEEGRWNASVRETRTHVIPLIANVDGELALGLLEDLGKAMASSGRGARGRPGERG